MMCVYVCLYVCVCECVYMYVSVHVFIHHAWPTRSELSSSSLNWSSPSSDVSVSTSFVSWGCGGGMWMRMDLKCVTVWYGDGMRMRMDLECVRVCMWWVSEWVSEWMHAWVSARGEWVNEWVSEWVSTYMWWVSVWVYVVSEWMSEWVHVVSEWMHEWMSDRCLSSTVIWIQKQKKCHYQQTITSRFKFLWLADGFTVSIIMGISIVCLNEIKTERN